MRGARAILLAALIVVAAAPAAAVTPDEQLSDPKLEARAVHISRELRCVVCQNQTIDDSDAPLAHDLRLLLRERLKAGDTDAQARDYIVARYGHYVLLKPPMEPLTLLLWFGPLLALIGGGLAAWSVFRTRRAAPDTALTADETAEVDRLIAEPRNHSGTA